MPGFSTEPWNHRQSTERLRYWLDKATALYKVEIANPERTRAGERKGGNVASIRIQADVIRCITRELKRREEPRHG